MWETWAPWNLTWAIAVKIGKVDGMNPVRGIVMLLAAVFAAWKGWKIHSGSHAWMAYGLAVAALAMAVWHFTREPESRRELER